MGIFACHSLESKILFLIFYTHCQNYLKTPLGLSNKWSYRRLLNSFKDSNEPNHRYTEVLDHSEHLALCAAFAILSIHSTGCKYLMSVKQMIQQDGVNAQVDPSLCWEYLS